MSKIPHTDRKDWIFLIGMILFAGGFWAQPFLVALDKHNAIIGAGGIISIIGLVAVVVAVEPHKAKRKNYYPLAFLVIIVLEIILQVIARLIF